MHKINIDELANDDKMEEFDNSSTDCSDDGGVGSNPANQREEKPFTNFIVADYADYRPADNISKCLIKNCDTELTGCLADDIKRHYHLAHKLFIVIFNRNEDSDQLVDDYENEEFENSEHETEEFISVETDQTSFTDEYKSFLKTETHLNDWTRSSKYLNSYVNYNKLTNTSRCLVPDCKHYLEGKHFNSIKRHYSLVHNLDIDDGELDLNKLVTKNKRKVTPTKKSIPVEDLVVHDAATDIYQCLFINCNLILEKKISTIKKHYRERHKIIIAKDSYDVDHHTILKKLKYQEQQDNVVKNEPLDESWYDENDYLLDNVDEEQPHCSTSKDKPINSDISITKIEFLKLCLGLIIERDFPLSLFDDDDFFKPLLAPYEQLFNCNLNASIMESIMIKANDIIVADLKEIFANKIVCSELIVVHHNGGYYLVFNVRYIEDEVIHNKIIGVTPCTKSTDYTPITECLKKFNINYDQVYTTSLLTTNTQPYDCELDTICYKIRDYNYETKYSPIYVLQETLNNFILKFKDDIMKWQQIAEFDDKNFMDTMGNFKRFKEYLEDLRENDTRKGREFRNPIKFMKTIQICWNFMDKFDGEQYVIGDFYRDWLCCELELKQLMKQRNQYAGPLNEEMSKCKLKIIERDEFLSALYLDPRFSFLGSRILNEVQKVKAKHSLLKLHENVGKFLPSLSLNNDNLSNNTNETNDDEYALLEQHINDTMAIKVNLLIEDKLNNCVSLKREPFNMDVLKYWRYNRNDMEINKLSQIAFAFPISQYVLKSIENDFMVPTNDIDKFDKFLIKHNFDILEKHIDLILESFI